MRFPAEEQEEAVEQPTEALDVAADLGSGGRSEAEVEGEARVEERDGEPLPDGLDDLEPPPEFPS